MALSVKQVFLGASTLAVAAIMAECNAKDTPPVTTKDLTNILPSSITKQDCGRNNLSILSTFEPVAAYGRLGSEKVTLVMGSVDTLHSSKSSSNCDVSGWPHTIKANNPTHP